MSTVGRQPATRPDDAQSVSELTARVKERLETGFADVWVTGEVTNLTAASSGHLYLALKDEQALLRAVVWRGIRPTLAIEPTDGLQVICHGRIEVYAPRGSYQLTIDRCHALGTGTLEARLRELHGSLEAEGLFAPERKRPLPRFPRRIGLVTSPSGAAIADFLETLAGRWPLADVFVFPSRVQGAGAAAELATSLARAGQLQPPLDVIALIRGGGSLEDLWAFNEEPVVRAIAASPVPVISGVGHEIDVSLADLVADCRGLTPTDAAVRIAIDRQLLFDGFTSLGARLQQCLRRQTAAARQQLCQLAASRPLTNPFEPAARQRRKLADEARRLRQLGLATVRQLRDRLAAAAGRLEANSPVGLLARGYSVTQRADGGGAIRSWREAPAGTTIVTQLADGTLRSRVETGQPAVDSTT
ncbi:MAG: exodeoxyribonuclease VII large subunit [Planctomycetia bacterium]|jgi:exodeoxyribonuclease VII large subunit|nr:exodeoxyribonuclease VII large subunit [Planctomycetia bacterium]